MAKPPCSQSSHWQEYMRPTLWCTAPEVSRPWSLAQATFYPGCHLPGSHEVTKAWLELECDYLDPRLVPGPKCHLPSYEGHQALAEVGEWPAEAYGRGRPGAAAWVGQNQAHAGHSSWRRSKRKKRSMRKASWIDPHHSGMTQTPNVNSLCLPQGSASGPENPNRGQAHFPSQQNSH